MEASAAPTATAMAGDGGGLRKLERRWSYGQTLGSCDSVGVECVLGRGRGRDV